MHGTLTTMGLKRQSNRTTRPVRQWTERTHVKVDPAGGAGCGEVAGCAGGADLRGNRLRAGCGLWQLPQWEKLLVSQESPLKSELETSR